MDYQALAISECLVKNLLSTWLSFITWNQLFAVVGIISSVLLTVPRELLLAKEMSQFSSCVHCLPHALVAKASHLPFTSSSCVCCYLSARTGSHPSDVEKWILLYFGRLLGQQPRSKPQTNVIWGWIYYLYFPRGFCAMPLLFNLISVCVAWTNFTVLFLKSQGLTAHLQDGRNLPSFQKCYSIASNGKWLPELDCKWGAVSAVPRRRVGSRDHRLL